MAAIRQGGNESPPAAISKRVWRDCLVQALTWLQMNRIQGSPSRNMYLVRVMHKSGTQGTYRSGAADESAEMAGDSVSPSPGVHRGHGELVKDFRKQSQQADCRFREVASSAKCGMEEKHSEAGRQAKQLGSSRGSLNKQC